MCTFPSACLPHERYFPSITTFPPQGIFPLGQYLHLNEYFPMNKYASAKLVSPENGKWWLCPCRSKEKLLKVCCWGWCMCINIFADMTVDFSTVLWVGFSSDLTFFGYGMIWFRQYPSSEKKSCTSTICKRSSMICLWEKWRASTP